MPLYNDLEVRPRYGSALPSYAPEEVRLEPTDELDLKRLALEAAKAGALGAPVAAGAGAVGRAARNSRAIKAASAATADELFDQAALAFARNPGYNARWMLTQMSPDDFLALARDFDDYPDIGLGDFFGAGPNPNKLYGVLGAIESGSPLRDIPSLKMTDPRSSYYPEGRVIEHEGRHRATVLRDLGYETMPVELTAQNLRWDSQAPESRVSWAGRPDWNYIENLPSELGSESPFNDVAARTRPAPYHTEGPLRGQALRTEGIRRPLGRRIAGGLGRLARSAFSPAQIAADLVLGGAVGAGSALGGHFAGGGSPESAGLFTPPGEGYEGLVRAEDIERVIAQKELEKEAERRRLLEQYRATGYDLDPNTRLSELR